MSVLTCCHACHIDNHIIMMTVNLVPKLILRAFVQYDHQITDNQCTNEELSLPGNDLVAEQRIRNITIKRKITKWQGLSSYQ